LDSSLSPTQSEHFTQRRLITNSEEKQRDRVRAVFLCDERAIRTLYLPAFAMPDERSDLPFRLLRNLQDRPGYRIVGYPYQRHLAEGPDFGLAAHLPLDLHVRTIGRRTRNRSRPENGLLPVRPPVTQATCLRQLPLVIGKLSLRPLFIPFHEKSG
jgi:hypothetical protein